MGIFPNAYYNYKKHRKSEYEAGKQQIKEQIQAIYHEHGGVDGYRTMKAYLDRKNIKLSNLTVHKYMNVELGLKSITRKKKPDSHVGKPHKVFPNLINQDFSSDKINTKWCTDFTYVPVDGDGWRYNCTILDLHERIVIASITDRRITSDLAKRTLEKALKSQGKLKGKLILHSDQGSQYTSKEFVDFCEKMGVTQSMSKAGYPYDNAPMERYFNTLKSELIYQHSYKTEEELYSAIEEYAYVTYNHIRPHSYNGYKTPFEARTEKSKE